MNGENLVIYRSSDLSDSTDLCTSGARTIPAAGSIIHTTSGADSLQWLQGGSCASGNPAGSDYLIKRSGERLQLQPSGRYAYHAGKSQYTLDRTYYNNQVSQKLLGIELECLDTQSPTFEQYDSLGELVVELAGQLGWRWPFIILGHYAVARPQGRRADPVNFDWGWFMGRLYVRAQSAGIAGM